MGLLAFAHWLDGLEFSEHADLRSFYTDTCLHDIPWDIFGLALSAIKKYLDADSGSCRYKSNRSSSP